MVPGTGQHRNPLLLTQQFPWVRPEDVAPYLVQSPTTINEAGCEDADLAEYDRLTVPARPGDEFRRFDECAALDFLRLLGIRAELRDHYVTLRSPVYRTFRIEGDPWLSP